MQPLLGLYFKETLNHLQASGEVRSAVLAPVLQTLLLDQLSSRLGYKRRIAKIEDHADYLIYHPTSWRLPWGAWSLPWSLAAQCKTLCEHLLQAHELSSIVAYPFYPDGLAAALIGRWLTVPVQVLAESGELARIAASPLARHYLACGAVSLQTIWLENAQSSAHVPPLFEPYKIVPYCPRIDLSLYAPQDNQVEPFYVLVVAELMRTSSFKLLTQLLRAQPDVMLQILGEHDAEPMLRRRLQAQHLMQRVSWIDAENGTELAARFNACQLLMILDKNTGVYTWILKALACGTPVLNLDPIDGLSMNLPPPAYTEVAKKDVQNTLAAPLAQRKQRMPRAQIANLAQALLTKFGAEAPLMLNAKT